MRLPIIKDGRVRVESEDGAWGNDLYRSANSHEVVPALIQIIEGLQDRINELETWRQRVSDR